MDAQAILTIGTAVSALVQLTKWGLARRDPSGSYGPVLVVIFAALGVALWSVSQPTLPTRLDIWPIFAAWVAVAITAAGVYGFVRTVGPVAADALGDLAERIAPAK